MKILSSIALIAALLSAVPTAYAVPNIWSSGFGMGVSEYIITGPQDTGLNISCTSNPDDTQVLQHSVLVTLPGGRILSSHDENTQITLVTGDEQYGVPRSLGWRNGDNAWVAFIDAVKKATSFEVWVNDKKVASFTPSASNVHKVLADMSACTSLTAD
ncbi:hypothetical protein [Klebsiella michiganensis]|uniref:hypothetical protein n=1 Tax=Klebsiella michiganensis TaxID=1134687 RepID=UPI002247CE78|nr:hypothetical protein [Klebsiella michiganensis]MCW9614093.1 hypothetical protein [Klebsiella michiganensis]